MHGKEFHNVRSSSQKDRSPKRFCMGVTRERRSDDRVE